MEAGREAVLVTEDDPLVAGLVCELLEYAGHTVIVASTGTEALERLQQGGIGLVLLDLMLPDIDGLELCRHIRASAAPVYLPIIMLTALGGDARRHTGFEAGADDYVSKPFGADDLLDRVAVWTRARQRLRTAHEALVADQARLRELEQQTLREQLASDEAVIAMARTASHELNQPLTVLLGLLELWTQGLIEPDRLPTLRGELDEAASELATRIDALTRVVRFETRHLAGIKILDLDRARQP